MADLYTYIIYLGTLAIAMLLTSSLKLSSYKNVQIGELHILNIRHFIGILLISIIVGFRYNVGVDWIGYRLEYDIIQANPSIGFSDQYMEFGFFYINKLLAGIGLSYEWMFFTIALITWYFFFKSSPTVLIPFFIYFIFVDEYFFWGMNGVRQFTAMSLWMFGIQFIINRKLYPYIIIIICASLFHRSSLLLLPMYFIVHIKQIKINLWLFLFALSLIIGSTPAFVELAKSILSLIGQQFDSVSVYTRYIDSEKFSIDSQTELGLGFWFKIVINFVIILISRKVVITYPKSQIYFLLFFIGAVLFNLTYNVQLLGRINHYFLIIRPFVLALIAFHFWSSMKYRPIVIMSCMLYLLLFIRAISISSNLCAPYQFSI